MVKSADIPLPLHVSGVGPSPVRDIYETSQVLFVGAPGVFSRGYPVYAPPTDWPVSYELKNLERDLKQNKKIKKSSYIRNFKLLCFCGYRCRFVSDLVRNLEYRCVAAEFLPMTPPERLPHRPAAAPAALAPSPWLA